MCFVFLLSYLLSWRFLEYNTPLIIYASRANLAEKDTLTHTFLLAIFPLQFREAHAQKREVLCSHVLFYKPSFTQYCCGVGLVHILDIVSAKRCSVAIRYFSCFVFV